MKVQDLSLQERIGQMMIVGMDSNYMTDRIKKLILKYKIGGIILYRKNFNTYESMLKLIKDLQDLNSINKVPLFIAIDQEGGRVNRMPKEILNLPPASEIAKLKDIDIINESASITGEILKKSGYNMDFAPVLDIKRFANKHAIGDRCFGDNVEDVCKYGIATMKSLQEKGIVSVIKHFPGHGATKRDSHYTLPIVNKNAKQLEKEDMKVFEEAIKQGADAIMVGHLQIKDLTGIYPASLSRKFIGNYLRKKYKYNGVVITDDLKMKAIKFLYGPKLAIRKAFEAGNDIVVFRFNKREEERAIKQVLKLVKKNKIKQCRINRSVNRVLKLKEKYDLQNNSIEGINIDEINKRIQKIKDLV